MRSMLILLLSCVYVRETEKNKSKNQIKITVFLIVIIFILSETLEVVWMVHTVVRVQVRS